MMVHLTMYTHLDGLAWRYRILGEDLDAVEIAGADGSGVVVCPDPQSLEELVFLALEAIGADIAGTGI